MIKMEQDKIRFSKRIISFGNSKGVILNQDILNFLDNPKEVYIMPDKNKHGRFLAIYSTKQKEVKNDNNEK